MNVSGLVDLLMPVFEQSMKAMLAGKPHPGIDKNEMDAIAARVPMKPDRNLR